jgi:methylmalonyl-CoA mutase C-terminal domain/subunit
MVQILNNKNIARSSKRILIAKLGLDGHDRGVKIIINMLKDAGYQVIYSGLHKLPMQIVQIGVQEDVDAIGFSILSGSHVELITDFLEIWKTFDDPNVSIFAGGIISKTDEIKLKAIGVDEVFPTETDLKIILAKIDDRMLT